MGVMYFIICWSENYISEFQCLCISLVVGVIIIHVSSNVCVFRYLLSIKSLYFVFFCRLFIFLWSSFNMWGLAVKVIKDKKNCRKIDLFFFRKISSHYDIYKLVVQGSTKASTHMCARVPYYLLLVFFSFSFF